MVKTKLRADDIVEEKVTHKEEMNLEARAKAVLKQNDRGIYTIPAENIYPHQWLWDSCFIAIGIRHYDVERAKMEILSLLRAQWHNGMLPHIILSEQSDIWKHRNIWRSWVSPYSSELSTSGITQPPVLAEAIVRIGEMMDLTERRQWYRQVYPGLLAYHQWLYRERDPHGEGLVLQIHPWETGLDNTPPWMQELRSHLLPSWIRALQFTHLEALMSPFRRDARFMRVDERLSNVEALALYTVQRRLRRKSYDINKILDHSLFAIEDLTFNCILIRANEHLKHIAKSLREDVPADLLDSIEKAPKALEQLWDPFANEYFSRDFVTHRLLKTSSIAALMPLYAGCISEDRAAKLVKLLENEHLFGPPYPIPSTPLNSPYFNPHRYWQGPTWFNTNWLIIDGLERYGYKDHAAALRETSLELVELSGFHEYFDPINGSPAGINNFSWTASLTIDFLHAAK